MEESRRVAPTLPRLAMVLSTLIILTVCSLAAGASASTPAASPTQRCWIFDKVYAISSLAFEAHHATAAEQREINKWALPSSPTQDRLVAVASPFAVPPLRTELHLLRWMRNPYGSGLFVFVARDIYHTNRAAYFEMGVAPWIALNSNTVIDTVDCSVHPYPTA